MSGHTMRVTLDRETVQLVPECHEPDGAVCRVECPKGCETYSYPDHEHGLVNVPYCNAVESLTNGDVECCCESNGLVPVPLSDGMAIEVSWNGDGYEWSPVESEPRHISLPAELRRIAARPELCNPKYLFHRAREIETQGGGA